MTFDIPKRAKQHILSKVSSSLCGEGLRVGPFDVEVIVGSYDNDLIRSHERTSLRRVDAKLRTKEGLSSGALRTSASITAILR